MSHSRPVNLDPSRRPALVSPVADQGDRVCTPCAHTPSYPSLHEDIDKLLNYIVPGGEAHSPVSNDCAHSCVIAPPTTLSTSSVLTDVRTDNTATADAGAAPSESFSISNVGFISPIADPVGHNSNCDPSRDGVSFAADPAAAVPPGNGSSRVLVLGAVDDNAATDELSIGVTASHAGTCAAATSATRRALLQEQGDIASFVDATALRPEASPSLDAAPVVHPAVSPQASTCSAEEVVDFSTNVHNNAAPIAERSARVVVASNRSGSFPLNSSTAHVPRPEPEGAGHPTAGHRVANCDAVLVPVGSSVPGVTSTPTAADATSPDSQPVEHAARVHEYTVTNVLSSHNIVDHDNLSASHVTLAVASVVGTTVSETTVAAPVPGQPTVRVESWLGYMIFDAFPYDEGGPRVPFDRDELPTDLAFFH